MKRESGQTYIDLVVAIPILVAFAFLMVQGVMIAGGVDATTKAARDAARAVTLDRDPRAAAAAALPDGVRLESVERYECDGVCVRVRANVPIGVKGFATTSGMDITRTAEFPDVG
ncbi:hypothetical protein [Luteipulveratus halotolerans]|uniref:Pilus assembly protein TadE n=1 Tax=Luteipulveratus halotolerans TaxID=1631356 RepID=A0A0L6CL32_9MICO|nr:hypothetical protein [Luteipulveratus halotolerans]KNX38355.1 hypothetical protein VV01_16305 [Luteipulveratus halotolerans]